MHRQAKSPVRLPNSSSFGYRMQEIGRPGTHNPLMIVAFSFPYLSLDTDYIETVRLLCQTTRFRTMASNSAVRDSS